METYVETAKIVVWAAKIAAVVVGLRRIVLRMHISAVEWTNDADKCPGVESSKGVKRRSYNPPE